MNDDTKTLFEDLSQTSNPVWIRANLGLFDSSLKEIYEDDSYDGEMVLDAGIHLFAYLADLIKHDVTKGLEAWSVVYGGYPEFEYSALYFPYFDVMRTKELWGKEFAVEGEGPILAEILWNVYLRSYIATMELGRKMLVFAAYCRSQENGCPFSLKNMLFGTGNPINTLKGWGPSGRDAIWHFYNTDIRHALAHANIVLVPGKCLVIHTTDDKKQGYIRRKYDFPGDTDLLVKDLQEHVEPIYQSVRVFFLLFGYVRQRNEDFILSHLPSIPDDDLTKDITDFILSKHSTSP